MNNTFDPSKAPDFVIEGSNNGGSLYSNLNWTQDNIIAGPIPLLLNEAGITTKPIALGADFTEYRPFDLSGLTFKDQSNFSFSIKPITSSPSHNDGVSQIPEAVSYTHLTLPTIYSV